MTRFFFLLTGIALLLAGCGNSRKLSNPYQKIAPSALRADMAKLRSVMESSHPGLYWYTPKDSMDQYFEAAYAAIKDSMTTMGFRNVVAEMVAHIKCGHSSVRLNPAQSRFVQRRNTPSFPLFIKTWPGDTMVVLGNINRRDSILKRGTVITSINGKTVKQINDTLFRFMVTDGNILNHKYQSLSNNFSGIYHTVFPLDSLYDITYLDTGGRELRTTIKWYNPKADTLFRIVPFVQSQKPGRREIKERVAGNIRSLRIDTGSSVAVLTVNSFTGGKLRKFFRNGFKRIKRDGIKNLVIELRSNGGGNVKNYVDLTKYIRSTRWKVADSVVAIRRNFGFNFFEKSGFLYWLGMNLLTHKRKDKLYHFTWWERHWYYPYRKHHFNGKVFVITGGNTFSAATLLTAAVKGQPGVTIIGEETGGGGYGNSGMMIPDFSLPNSGLLVRLPLFKIVIDKNGANNGRGVMPDVPVPPRTDAIRQTVDIKMEVIRRLIQQ
jgi:Peptidase family S41